MAKKPLRIGLIGYGFMGRAHSNAYAKVGHFFDSGHEIRLGAVCARDEEKAKAFAERWGYASVETDWRALVRRDDIDVVDICVPNNLHAEIAVAAAEAGKMILCEKPLAMNPVEAEKMVAAVEKAKVPNMVWYNYRRCPAVTLAKQLIDQGRLGRIFHYRAKFLQDWTINPELPQGGAGLWRLDVEAAGSGVTGDLLAHCIDTALWLNGPIDSVSAVTETFVKERRHTLTGRVEKVGIDDACAFLARFANGSLATFESTRYARGHKALYTLEINGEHASIAWDLHDLHRLQYFDHKDEGIVRGWRNVHVSDGDQPYLKNWWVPGLQIGYEHSFVHQVADFMRGLDTGTPAKPDFRDGLATDYVVDAVLNSAKSGAWTAVKHPAGENPAPPIEASTAAHRPTAAKAGGRRGRPLRVVVRPHSDAETTARRGPASTAPVRAAEAAPGFAPRPDLNLQDHGGKIITDLTFTNFYLGGADAWDPSDIQNIDANLSAAMSDTGLNNVLLQYFRGAPAISSTFQPSTVLPGAAPGTLSQTDVEALIGRLKRGGTLDGFDFANTVFNLMLPRGTVLTIGEEPGGAEAGASGAAAGDTDEKASSLHGLGGFHGSVAVDGDTVYYAVGVFSEGSNGIVAFDASWKNVVATFYHELVEARTDADVESGAVGWVNNEVPSAEIGDIPMALAGRDLSRIMVEAPLADGSGTVPVQLMWSNAVSAPEGPVAQPRLPVA